MSGRPAKRWKKGCLPPELLETTFGFLDAGTLCTARLVCAQFRSTASQFLHSVEISVKTLRRRPQITLSNFPNLRRVTVFDVKEADLLMFARIPVGHAITHVRTNGCERPRLPHGRVAAVCSLPPLPNLVSLTFRDGVDPVFPFPETLWQLTLGSAVIRGPGAMHLVARLTNLTCLQINLREASDAVTALTALQRLQICSELSVVPFVAELTLLTHLQFQGDTGDRRIPLPDVAYLASLTRLRRLVHLGFSAQPFKLHSSTSLEGLVLSSIAAFTGLMSLDLALSRRPDQATLESVHMTPFSQLTALRLRQTSYASGLLDASFLPSLNLERLQVLSISYGVQLDQDTVAALTRATSLTHLEVWTSALYASASLEELKMALPCLPRLRSLSLGTCKPYSTVPPDATFSLEPIKLLTELTMLELRGRGVTTDADLSVCLGLKRLRVLRMVVDVDNPTPAASDCITRESFFAMAKLPELRKLDLSGNFGSLGWDLRKDVRARRRTERRAKGWPPLELRLLVSLQSCQT